MSSGSVAKPAPPMVNRCESEDVQGVEISSSLPSLADEAVKLMMSREVIWTSATTSAGLLNT